MITSLIHANEPATRDALMAFLRDLAYSTDPAIVDYLSSHRIVALCPCNPDVAFRGRQQSQGININRDFYTFAAPETQVIMGVTDQVRPHMILDIHEYHGNASEPDWMYRAGGHPNTPRPIRTLEKSCIASGVAAMQSLGYSTQQYYDNYTMRTGRSTLAGPMNTVGVLSETNLAHPAVDRVLIQIRILEQFRAWHAANAAACTAARAEAIHLAETTNPLTPLYTQEYFGNDNSPEVLNLRGYKLHGQIPASHDLFGIEVEPNGFVPMMQEAQWVIPTLLDPASPERVVSASRVPHQIETDEVRVRVDGNTYEVIGARIDGHTHDVTSLRI